MATAMTAGTSDASTPFSCFPRYCRRSAGLQAISVWSGSGSKDSAPVSKDADCEHAEDDPDGVDLFAE